MTIVRIAQAGDKADIVRIYGFAREFMKQNGNPVQWGDGYPSEDLIDSDIKNKNGYVIEKDGKICGVFAFFTGEDPTYKVIEGRWLNDLPYGTIHRIASDGTAGGTLSSAVEYVGRLVNNIRIDTYKDNTVMQHVLDKNGFIRCGIIHLEDGSPRIAYQRVLKL